MSQPNPASIWRHQNGAWNLVLNVLTDDLHVVSMDGQFKVFLKSRDIEDFKEKNMSAKIKSYSWSILVSTISKRLYDEWKNYIKLQETREPFILWGSKNPWFPLSLFPSPPQNGSAFFCTLESTTTFLFSRSTRVGTTRGSKPRHWKGETSRGSA